MARKSAEQQRAEAEAARGQADGTSPVAASSLPVGGSAVRFDETVKVLTEVAAEREKRLDTNDAKAVEGSVRGLMALAEVSRAVGRLDNAEQAATTAAAQAETLASGQPTVLLAQALGLKADIIVARQPEQQWSRGEVAAMACRKAKDIAFLAYPPGDPNLYDRVAAEVSVLTALGRTEDAKRAIGMALDVCRTRFGAKHVKYQELNNRLASYSPTAPVPYAPAVIPRALE